MDGRWPKETSLTPAMKAPSDTPYAPSARVLSNTCEACRRLYGRRPGVLGVGAGLKFTDGAAHDDTTVIQFYVRRKQAAPPSGERLPRFVYARREDGLPDRSRRIATDVIELGQPRFAVRSGAPLDVIGESGALTMLFDNQMPQHPGRFLITCAHVAGEVTRTPPVDPRITLPGSPHGALFATTLVNATAQGGRLAYDIALAEVATGAPSGAACEVEGSPVPIRAFLPANELRPGLTLSCAFPVSHVPSARVCSGRTALPLRLDGQEYRVENLFLIDRPPRPGDSGGLLYEGERAAGLLVGLSARGFGLFQPLGEAFAHVQALCPFPLACFPPPQAAPTALSQPQTKGTPCNTPSSPARSPRSSAAASPAARRSSPAKRTSRKRRKACASIRPKST
jgi:hypothetical protein